MRMERMDWGGGSGGGEVYSHRRRWRLNKFDNLTLLPLSRMSLASITPPPPTSIQNNGLNRQTRQVVHNIHTGVGGAGGVMNKWLWMDECVHLAPVAAWLCHRWWIDSSGRCGRWRPASLDGGQRRRWIIKKIVAHGAAQRWEDDFEEGFTGWE